MADIVRGEAIIKERQCISTASQRQGAGIQIKQAGIANRGSGLQRQYPTTVHIERSAVIEGCWREITIAGAAQGQVAGIGKS